MLTWVRWGGWEGKWPVCRENVFSVSDKFGITGFLAILDFFCIIRRVVRKGLRRFSKIKAIPNQITVMIEFLDVYDANRKLVGTADRAVVHTFGLWHKVVHCWVVWNDKLVFQRRSHLLDNNPGKLYTTASGHVSAGENFEQAFKREVRQEIGVVPQNPMPLYDFVFVQDIKKTDGSLFVDRVFASFFWAKYDGNLSDFVFSNDEIDSLVAIDLETLLKWSHNPADKIEGQEWDGKKLTDVKLVANEFLVNSGETVYSRYGKVVEMIKEQILGYRH